MTANELHVLRAIHDENHGLLGGYDDDIERLLARGLILRGPSGLWLSDSGRAALNSVT